MRRYLLKRRQVKVIMQRSSLRIYNQPSAKIKELAEKCGFACMMMSATASRLNRGMHHIRTIIEPAISHNQIKFYFNDTGKPVGYVAWAFLAEDTEERFFRTGRMNLHLSEWNEGSSLWIIDLVAPFGHVKYILQDLRDVIFSQEEKLRYYRLKKSKVITKQVSRSMHSAFFKVASELAT